MQVEINELQFDTLLKHIAKLPIEENVENSALNKAAKLVKAAIIEEAPQDEREELNHASIKNNIFSYPPKDGRVIIHTGGAHHAHLVEFGRSGGSKMAEKNGKEQLVTWGPTQANPFFTRGFEKSQINALQTMEDEIKKALGL